MVQHHRQIRRRDQGVRAQSRRHHVGEVRLQVRDVILLREGHDRPAHRRGHVLVDGVLLLRLHRRVEQLLRVRDLQRVEQALFDFAQVVQLRHGGSALRHGLHLSEALRLAEDVRVADGHHVERALEVGARGQLLADLGVHVLVVEVHGVEPVQDAQQLGHAVVQARVDGAEDDHALLDLGERGADRRVRVAVRDVIDRGADDALARVDEEAEQLIQNCGRWVVRQGHDQLADVVRRHAALDLHHLRRLDLEALPALAAALQLQHGLAVADVRAVEQGTQRARRRGRQTADHVRQADRVRASPRHERELDEPVQLFLCLVELVPVAVDRQHLARRFIYADDVRQRLVALDVGDRVHLVHGAQAVLVVARLFAALDLVVRLLGDAVLGLHARRAEVDVAVHAALDAALVVNGRQVLHVRLALRAVEVRRGERQVHVVDRDEQEVRAVARLRPRHLHVLRTAQRHLRQQLLQLGAELAALHGQLPVHEGRLALRLLDLIARGLARDEVLDRPLRREQLLDGARREVDAGLGQHRMHDLGRALELRAARRVIAQPGAAQAFLVLLVALLARFLVLADQIEVRLRQRLQFAVGHVLGEVGVEVLGACLALVLVVEAHDGTAVGRVDHVVIVGIELKGLGLGQIVIVFHARSSDSVRIGNLLGRRPSRFIFFGLYSIQ